MRTTSESCSTNRMLLTSGMWLDGGGAPERRTNKPLDAHSPSDPPTSSPRRQILIVEDNRADLFLIRESIQAAGLEADLQTVQDGEKAIRFLEDADRNPNLPCPDLIVLDINLPKRSGREVVRQMRQSPRCARALVVVVTSSDSEQDRDEMAKLGARAYFRKPSDYASFLKLGELVKSLLEETPGSSGHSQLP